MFYAAVLKCSNRTSFVQLMFALIFCLFLSYGENVVVTEHHRNAGNFWANDSCSVSDSKNVCWWCCWDWYAYIIQILELMLTCNFQNTSIPLAVVDLATAFSGYCFPKVWKILFEVHFFTSCLPSLDSWRLPCNFHETNVCTFLPPSPPPPLLFQRYFS